MYCGYNAYIVEVQMHTHEGVMQGAGGLFESDLDAHSALPGQSGALPSTNGRAEPKLSYL